MLLSKIDQFFLAWILIGVQITRSQLMIRPVYVYEHVIRGMHDYFNNTCIILLHNTPNVIENTGEL